MTDTSPSQSAAALRPPSRSPGPARQRLRRARWSDLLGTAVAGAGDACDRVGLFLAVSWLGLWLWLPPLARAAGRPVRLARGRGARSARVGAVPVAADGLRRLDRRSGLPHRPATTIADELAVTSAGPVVARAVARPCGARACRGARFKAGWPSPRLELRDPIALRALVLIVVVATFVAAGGERGRRIAAAFDWQGVVVPANFRLDAWVSPPAYTGKPPVILAGMRPGETPADARRGGLGAGRQHSGRPRERQGQFRSFRHRRRHAGDESAQAPAGTEEHRFTIAVTGTATVRGVGDDLT